MVPQERITHKKTHKRRLILQRESSNSVKIRYQPSKNDIMAWADLLFTLLIENYNLNYFAIFGSYASGQHGVGSDIDLVIVHDSNLTFETALSHALDISKKIDWEIHLYSLQTFKTGLDEKNTFFQAMLHNNINIYQSKEFKTLLTNYEY